MKGCKKNPMSDSEQDTANSLMNWSSQTQDITLNIYLLSFMEQFW